MFLTKNIQIIIFKIDNTTFEPIGELTQYTSFIWPDMFNGYANFELWAPIMDDNSELIKKGNFIWCGGDNAGIIEIVKSQINDNGEKSYHVKGRTLEKLLLDRIIWGGYTKSGLTSSIMYDIIKTQCISPVDSRRKIPYLVCTADKNIGKRINNYQKTGKPVYDAISDLATESDIGFSVKFDPYNKQFVFDVYTGVDRTMENTTNDVVVFDTDLEDILSSEYYSSIDNYKTVAFVQGEDKGSNRKSVTVGNENGSGLDRKELYVDARDVQSEVSNGDSGETVTLSTTEYIASLTQRGKEKLAENAITETFDAKIRQFGDLQYVFGKDYFKGDKVTVIDRQLMVKVSARITSVEESFGSEYSLTLTFGYSYPTMLEKVKRAIS